MNLCPDYNKTRTSLFFFGIAAIFWKRWKGCRLWIVTETLGLTLNQFSEEGDVRRAIFQCLRG